MQKRNTNNNQIIFFNGAFATKMTIGIFFACVFFFIVENYQRITFALRNYLTNYAITYNPEQAPFEFRVMVTISLGIYFFVVILSEIMKQTYESAYVKRQIKDENVSEALESVGIR